MGSSSLGKTLHTSFGNIGPAAATVANAFGKAVFIKCLCGDSALHARPLESEGLLNKHISVIACLSTAFVSGCWGYSLGLSFVVPEENPEKQVHFVCFELVPRFCIHSIHSFLFSFRSSDCCIVPTRQANSWWSLLGIHRGAAMEAREPIQIFLHPGGFQFCDIPDSRVHPITSHKDIDIHFLCRNG